ncbi:hypothetical protein O181_023376 [Austropuccinia psidii MF-1]|uniref:Uncharacterized protein n=1 Tax=Austropuccinia psidii MF-1 TaxID=1389203 RepID=A0A9Q3CEN5_9BASI|nr:hypothetical protein [Austropuccinia psidii MF-1]
MEDSKGWLFWIPERGTVICLASMKFYEESFFQQKSVKKSTLSKIRVTNLFDGSMIKQLNTQDSFISTLNLSSDIRTALPTTSKEAVSSPQADQWKKAIMEELESMNEQNLFVATKINEALKETP